MKTLKNRILAAAAVVALSVLPARADYQITFDTLNDSSAPTNPIFDVGGSTKLLGSAGFVGQLYTQFGAGSFTAIGSSVAFLNGGGQGFIQASPRDITVLTGSVTANPTVGAYQLRVWNTANGSTYEAASAVVGAHIGSVTVSGVNFAGYLNGTLAPVSFPQANGFASFSLTTVAAVPEPATLALGLFGAAGLLFRRRK